MCEATLNDHLVRQVKRNLFKAGVLMNLESLLSSVRKVLINFNDLPMNDLIRIPRIN